MRIQTVVEDETAMNASIGQERFNRWRNDPRMHGFASRLLVRWLQWQCGCTQKTAIAAVRSLPEEGNLDDLVLLVTESGVPHATRPVGRD
ncbi:hypothetical protein [Variovorax ginsengisoli]|uniref:Uncharacterized protein n=1 Tax=Variovorax ginsengisoli TaxID=363844 RepID=A0ABT9SFY4_9BURK|nr:hypothetical protein [Variovorax ginsengisoli]MDP9902703.1 hypothetical protein [Variovorax ginsengisoli]